ncbi:hypothetical protein Hanom_Chr09g00801251 [Helianthus anomalus]
MVDDILCLESMDWVFLITDESNLVLGVEPSRPGFILGGLISVTFFIYLNLLF